MDTWIKVVLGIIGGGSVLFGIVVLMLFLIGEPGQAKEVRQIPTEIEEDISGVKTEVVTTGKNVLGQMNEDRKNAIANEKDPNIRGIINIIYLYAMFIVVAVFVSIFKGLSQIKIG